MWVPCHLFKVAHPGFPGGATTSKVGVQTYFLANFPTPKNCKKLKEIELRGARASLVPPPLDSPLIFVAVVSKSHQISWPGISDQTLQTAVPNKEGRGTLEF